MQNCLISQYTGIGTKMDNYKHFITSHSELHPERVDEVQSVLRTKNTLSKFNL